MLPILRILPVGGVLLAILLMILALKVPGERMLPSATLTARDPQLEQNEDPQWRQVAIQAALRRANELMRLRELPDTPMRSEPPAPPVSEPEPPMPETAVDAPRVAGLPIERLDADPDPDSITGSIEEAPGATIPIEIGATSSSELPVVLPEERPAIIRIPEPRPAHESRHIRPHRRPKATRAQSQPTPQIGFLDELFGGQRLSTVGSGANFILNQTPAHRADIAGY